jgi:hypothetical protein
VTAKNSTGTGTAVEGMLVPRVDRQKAQSMTGVPVSTLIYVNSIATGTATGTALNIDTVGYYYYNGTVWTKLSTPVNIYNADGTLTGNRIVTQGANTLAFTGTQTNAFSVDGNTLSVDAANDYVGIGTATPDTKLTINAPDNSFGLNHTNGTVKLKTYIGGGVASLGTTTTHDLRLMVNNLQKMSITTGGNVGIGTMSPTNKLAIVGTNAQPSAQGTANTNATLRIDGSSNHSLDFGTYINSPYGAYISTQNKTGAAGLPLVLNPTGGNVGVGTDAPDHTLDVNGNVRFRSVAPVTSANNSGILLADGGGVVSQISTNDFVGSLKIPGNIFSAEQTTDVPTNLAGNNIENNVVFGTVNINAAGAGTWNAANNTYTVAKAGIYQVTSGVNLQFTTNTSFGMYISMASSVWVQPGVSQAGNIMYFNGTYVKLLAPGDTIRCYTKSANTGSYRQGVAFIHIIYTPL